MMTLILPGITGTIDIYMKVLREICGDTTGKSMIDLMCCFAPNTPKLGFEKRTYIDIIDRKLDHESEQEFFTEADALDLLFIGHWEKGSPKPTKYDVSICSDGIEHLTVEDGYHLLAVMDDISLKQILFTPTTELFGMAGKENFDPEAHRSLWTPEMMPGYATIVFPDFHPSWNSGAFFAFKCENVEQEFQRIKTNLIL